MIDKEQFVAAFAETHNHLGDYIRVEINRLMDAGHSAGVVFNIILTSLVRHTVVGVRDYAAHRRAPFTEQDGERFTNLFNEMMTTLEKNGGTVN